MQVTRENNKLKLTQPVNSADTPGAPRVVLTPVRNERDAVKTEIQTKFRSGIGKLLHLMRWSRPDICNAVRDISRHGQKSNKAHLKAMKRCKKYCIQTRKMGWYLHPTRKWYWKNRDGQFVINEKSDSDYACLLEGLISFGGDMIRCKSSTQKLNTKSGTEAEVVGVSEFIPSYLWLTMFLKEQ